MFLFFNNLKIKTYVAQENFLEAFESYSFGYLRTNNPASMKSGHTNSICAYVEDVSELTLRQARESRKKSNIAAISNKNNI